ncbi:pre-mRNA-splicing factor SLU7 [Striga asiatica]|uniref:Pre-mRNA-splicing factor SLU7 n=1 Tax=Striga asiatica TaxID=4170 RepID=A0A5A7R6M9_STRAF|nr:pre-mRNA-splicing factor SLU7 [Striga asiatica]
MIPHIIRLVTTFPRLNFRTIRSPGPTSPIQRGLQSPPIHSIRRHTICPICSVVRQKTATSRDVKQINGSRVGVKKTPVGFGDWRVPQVLVKQLVYVNARRDLWMQRGPGSVEHVLDQIRIVSVGIIDCGVRLFRVAP